MQTKPFAGQAASGLGSGSRSVSFGRWVRSGFPSNRLRGRVPVVAARLVDRRTRVASHPLDLYDPPPGGNTLDGYATTSVSRTLTNPSGGPTFGRAIRIRRMTCSRATSHKIPAYAAPPATTHPAKRSSGGSITTLRASVTTPIAPDATRAGQAARASEA